MKLGTNGQKRRAGIELLGDVPWGTHFCQFYQTPQDLLDVLVGYFRHGLEDNEFCMWITSEPLGVEEARCALRQAVPDLDERERRCQIELLDYRQWYAIDGRFDAERVLRGWVEKEQAALKRGYEGLRLSGNTFWLEKSDWKAFADYEAVVDSVIGQHRMMALCTYSLEKCGSFEVLDVIRNHEFALIKQDGKWELIQSHRQAQAHEAMRQAKEDWEQTFNTVPDLVAILDDQHRVVRANQAMAARLGVTPDECVGLRCCEAVHGTTEPPAFCPHTQTCGDHREHTAEVHEPQLGGHFLVSTTPRFDEQGRFIGAVHVARDITERKRAEEALRQSGEQVRLKLQSILAPEGDIGTLELGDIIDVPAVQSLMDYFQRLAHIPMAILDLRGNVLVKAGWQDVCARFHRAHPETCKHCVESDTQLSAGVAPGEFKLYKCKNNMWDIATPIMVGGRHFGNLFAGQFFFDDEPVDQELFRSQARRYGFDEQQYLAALETAPRLSRESVDAAMGFFTTLAQMLSLLSYSNIKLARSLTERDASIAERNRAEEALRDSERRLRALGDQIPSGAIYQHLRHPDGRVSYAYMSAGVEGLIGLSAERVMADPDSFRQLVVEEDRAHLDAAEEESARNLTPFDCEFRQHTVSGQIKWVQCRSMPRRLEDGSILWDGVVMDITDRKHAEEALRLTQASVDGAAEMVAWFTTDGSVYYANDATCRTLGYSRDEIMKMTALDFSSGFTREQYEEHWREVRQRKSFTLEVTHHRKNGSYYPAEVLVNYVVYGGREFLFAYGRDITERKRAEEALKASLKEKEVLLKEIHHRVKNNMQVISSLVALQAERLQDDSMRDVLQDVTDRVRSMALVHEKLYQSADMAQVDFAEYVRSLLGYLWRAHSTAASGVRLSFNLEPVQLSVNAAVPCGLILNELATNALKHAFHGRIDGEVVISLRGTSEGGVCLCVRDNGTGLPPDLDWRHAHSLGLRIVQILAGQLRATIEVSGGEGTEFIITCEKQKT